MLLAAIMSLATMPRYRCAPAGPLKSAHRSRSGFESRNACSEDCIERMHRRHAHAIGLPSANRTRAASLTDKTSTPITGTDPITGQKTEVVFTEIEVPSHERAKELLAYWRDRTRSGGFAMGRDVPSHAIGHLMKHLLVFEPTEGGLDFRYRLVGTVLIGRLGRDPTGLTISEVYAEATARSFIASLKKTIERGQPIVHEAEVRGLIGIVRRAEGVLLPMKAPDGKTDWVLNGVFYR